MSVSYFPLKIKTSSDFYGYENWCISTKLPTINYKFRVWVMSVKTIKPLFKPEKHLRFIFFGEGLQESHKGEGAI